MRKIGLILLGCLTAVSVFAQNRKEAAMQEIERLLDQELAKANVHNVLLSIHSPSRKIDWHAAKGTFANGEKVTTEHPFYTASVGKTFTATAIGLLVDDGKMTFSDPIARHLPAQVMDSLHVLGGVNYSSSITVAHLLQHTSGLPDYFENQTADGAPSMFDLIMADPTRLWQPAELVAYAKAHVRPNFAPGTGYYYTDTEYVLLGMIVEAVSGMSLHDFFSTHIFTPLAMDKTYVNQRSEPKDSSYAMAEMYAGAYEISTLTSLSADWAGGAITSTGRDLIQFQKALWAGKLVSKATLNAMQQWTYETHGMMYGYGLRKIECKELFPDMPSWQLIGHSGLNGTSMYYCPDLDIYIAGTLNQLEASKGAVILMAQVLKHAQEL